MKHKLILSANAITEAFNREWIVILRSQLLNTGKEIIPLLDN